MKGQAKHTKTKLGRNSFIPSKGVSVRNQNCSVFRGISARSDEAPLLAWMHESRECKPEAGIFRLFSSLS
jgi:hypothetical protein